MAGFGDLSGLLKQAQRMQAELEKAKEELGGIEVEGSAAGGGVVVRLSANLEVRAVHVDPAVLEGCDAGRLEELFLAATAQALDRARAEARERMKRLTGGLSLPGMF